MPAIGSTAADSSNAPMGPLIMPLNSNLISSNFSAPAAAPHPHRRGLSEFSFLTSSFRRKRNNRGGGPGHHRRQSSIAQLIGTLGSDLNSIVEGVHDGVSNAVQEQLQEIDDGRTFFLESGVTRSMGMIPMDLPDFYHESTVSLRGLLFIDDEDDESTDGDDEEYQLPLKKQFLTKDTSSSSNNSAVGAGIGAYVGLLAAVVAISSNSTALSLERGVAPALKLYWRLSAVALLLSLLVLRQ